MIRIVPLRDAGEADVIVIGAGTAGCVVAARLAEDPSLRVLLLEAGPRDRNPWIHIPVGFSRLLNDPSVNWNYTTVPQQTLDGRQIAWPRGKVLGGSSAINGMVWVRGAPADFEAWADATDDESWRWSTVAADFARCEAAPADAAPGLGREGPITLSRPRHSHRLARAFVEAGRSEGLAMRPDLSIADATGVGEYLITACAGRRITAASAYLRPLGRRDNLATVTDARAVGILLGADGRANGVRVRAGADEVALEAPAGVIVCAGTAATPQLLLLSGIGPPDDLADVGITPRVTSADVGRNLQDHFGVRIIAKVCAPITVNDDFRRPWRLGWHALRYAVARRGPIAMGGAYAGAFLASDGGERPDLQVHFLPLSSERRGWSFHPFSGITANVCQMRPRSRGRVSLASRNPLDPPVIDPRYLSDPADTDVLLQGIRMTRRLLAAPPLGTTFGATEVHPGAGVQDDEPLLAYARQNGSTVFHPVGTCRMGKDDDAVVTPDFAVRGCDRLWIADASVMPSLTSGNTNAAVTVIAERAAQAIRRGLRGTVA